MERMKDGNEHAVKPLATRWPVHTEDEIAAVANVLRSGKTNYWQGPHGTALETEWSRATGVRNVLAVSNGTTALECALRGLGATGDELGALFEVVVPARTFIATASAVVHAGGKPVLADIDPATLCVTAATVEAAATERTIGVIVVHYGGLPCPDMDEIVRLCMRKGWWIIEDAAHAHGAPGVGLASHAVAWSCCVGKVLSTGGEGGLVGCLDAGVAERIAAWRDHGRYQLSGRDEAAQRMAGGAAGHARFDYCVEEFGSNLRMTEMQAVLGRHGVRRLPEEIKRRRWVAHEYDETLLACGVEPMFTPEQSASHVRYLYHVRLGDGRKAAAMTALNERGIPARFGGCDNIGKEPAFVKRGWNTPCPGADRAGEETFSLPCYPTMSDGDVARVCDAVREALAAPGSERGPVACFGYGLP